MIARTNTRCTLAVAAAFAIAASACGSDRNATGASLRAESTTTEMTPDASPDDVGTGASTPPSGPLCGVVPTVGKGSFAGMAADTAGTAASNNPALSTLVAAMVQSGLVDMLNSKGPFTIFAPINPAFGVLGGDAIAAALADEDALSSILALHVVAGRAFSSADLAELDSLETVDGASITISTADDGRITVNGQAVIGCADVHTANATMHIIDVVLSPHD